VSPTPSTGTRHSDSEKGGLWKVNLVSFVPLLLAVARVMRAELCFPQPTERDKERGESLVVDEQQALLGGQPVNSPMGSAGLPPSGLHGSWVDSMKGNGDGKLEDVAAMGRQPYSNISYGL